MNWRVRWTGTHWTVERWCGPVKGWTVYGYSESIQRAWQIPAEIERSESQTNRGGKT